MSFGSTFYEDDEPVGKIKAIFDRGPHGVTAPPDRYAELFERGWFADVDGETPEAATHRWQPVLQLDGMCLPLPLWFATEGQCRQFIRAEIVGKALLPDRAGAP